jgi:hypothetical protein
MGAEELIELGLHEMPMQLGIEELEMQHIPDLERLIPDSTTLHAMPRACARRALECPSRLG